MTKLIDDEMDKPEEVQDIQAVAMFQTQLGALIGSKSSYINEHEKLLTKKEFIDRANEKHSYKYDYSKIIYHQKRLKNIFIYWTLDIHTKAE